MIDIDRFKGINNTSGHDTNDQVFIKMSSMIRSFDYLFSGLSGPLRAL